MVLAVSIEMLSPGTACCSVSMLFTPKVSASVSPETTEIVIGTFCAFSVRRWAVTTTSASESAVTVVDAFNAAGVAVCAHVVIVYRPTATPNCARFRQQDAAFIEVRVWRTAREIHPTDDRALYAFHILSNLSRVHARWFCYSTSISYVFSER